MALLDSIVKGAKDLLDRYMGGADKERRSLSGNAEVDRYLKELGRAQKAYDEYNDPKLKEGAHRYAEQLRAEARAKGIDLERYGRRNQYGIDYREYYNEPGPAGKYEDRTKMPDWLNTGFEDRYNKQKQKRNHGYYRSGGGGGGGGGGGIASLLQQYYGSYQSNLANSLQGLDALAAQRAKAEIDAQLLGYRSAVPMLEAQRQNAINKILANLETSKKALDDEYFQKYLQSRQSLVNRGLNAGFEADANTRLGLAKMGEIADLQRSASQSQADTELQYAAQIAGVQDKIASIQAQAPALEARYLAELQQAAREQAMQEYQMQMDALKFAAPYMFMTAADEARLGFDQSKLAWEMQQSLNDALLKRYLHDTPSGDKLADLQWERYKFGNLSAEDQARLMLDQWKWMTPSANQQLSSSTQWGIAQLNNQVRLQIAQMNNETRRVLAELRQKGEREVPTEEEVFAFKSMLNPEEDTLEDQLQSLNQQLMAKEITPAEWRVYTAATKEFYNEWEKRKQAADRQAQASRQKFNDTRVNLWMGAMDGLFPSPYPFSLP